MWRVLAGVLGLGLSAPGAQAQALPPPPVPAYGQSVVVFEPPPAAVTCGGETVRVVRAPPAPPTLGWMGPGNASEKRVTVAFRVSPEGRALGIGRLVTDGDRRGAGLGPPDVAPPYIADEPLQAVLATWTFAPSRAGASGCQFTFVGQSQPADSMSRDVALRLIAAGEAPGSLRRQINGLAGLDAGDCSRGQRPYPRVIHYPDFAKVPARPGERSWTAHVFDIDAAGKPTNIRKAGSAGDAVLDDLGAKAIAASRFQPKARTGCPMWYWKAEDVIPAPPRPAGPYGRPEDDCPGGDILAFTGKPAYPNAFRRLQIEGWALVRFDVAPWGELGGMEVIASEPAAAFGLSAQNYLRRAKVKMPGKGFKGCVVPVAYRISDEDLPPNIE